MGRPLGVCGRRLPELDLIPIYIIDPGEATGQDSSIRLASILTPSCFKRSSKSVQIVHDVIDHERCVAGIEIVSGGGENSPNCDVFLLRVVVFAPRKRTPSPL